MDHESESGVLGRSPGSPPTGWDAGRAQLFLIAVYVPERRGGGSGDKRAQHEAVHCNGFGA